MKRSNSCGRALLSILLFLPLFLTAQSLVPADTLLDRDLNAMQRLAIRGVSSWQHLSFSHPGYNCQFEPSCSHFMALAVAEHGAVPGIIVGTDRILRCNPSARRNHAHTAAPYLSEDGRLLEPLDFDAADPQTKSPALAATLSLVPGVGRIYAGHTLDGLLSMLMIGAFGFATFQHADVGNTFQASLNGGITLFLWSADIYGAYRSARCRVDG